ncbi:hypothetical protein BDF20DRAFT_915588 [Mycotypha africana]|uniref:uncharacterized protein n=1 Tax=Mycotypha africana TaxID=64632 RepID=UPI002300B113|nr:uncharacterized protein BDF20DRAFT_915588 [Mycotypha africana]KAI8971828.1 hypothetical protein BDF20DRAFT_915588 [Mycotypha africana]
MTTREIIRRPDLMRSPPSTHVDTQSAHVRIFNVRSFSSLIKRFSLTSSTVILKPVNSANGTTTTNITIEQQRQLLQQKRKQLAMTYENGNLMDYSDNMHTLLNRESIRVDAEYKSIKLYQDPLALSLQRVASILKDRQQMVLQKQQPMGIGSVNIPAATVLSSSSAFSTIAPSLSSSKLSTSNKSSYQTSPTQRRASSHTIHEYLLSKKEARRHSLSQFYLEKSPPPTILSKFFGLASTTASQLCHSP